RRTADAVRQDANGHAMVLPAQWPDSHRHQSGRAVLQGAAKRAVPRRAVPLCDLVGRYGGRDTPPFPGMHLLRLPTETRVTGLCSHPLARSFRGTLDAAL